MDIEFELAPRPLLRPYIRLIWCLELPSPESFGRPERIAPDGIIEMVFHCGRPMAVRFADGRFALQPRSSLVSPTRRFIEIKPTGTTGLISFRFQPWGAHHFLPSPVSELADQIVPAEDVWSGSPVRELEDCLSTATDTRARVRLIEQFLVARLERYRQRKVEGLVREMWQRKGHVRVSSLSRESSPSTGSAS